MAKTGYEEFYVDWLGKMYGPNRDVQISITAHLRELMPYEKDYNGFSRIYKNTCQCPAITITIDNYIILNSEHVHYRSERIEGRYTVHVFKASNYPFLAVDP
jgi:hypothetical protein